MTFSVLALDGESGEFGVATATCTLAVGAAVQAVAPVGGVVTQGWTNRRFRAAGLGLLRSGLSAGEVLAELLHDDEAPARRQVAVLDLEGRVATHTGAELTTGWAGEMVGDAVVFIGNLLTGPEVLDEMAAAWASSGGSLSSRLVAALAAGDRAGGDARGRMSAALKVVSVEEDDVWPAEMVADLRVDDDPAAPSRLLELERAWSLSVSASERRRAPTRTSKSAYGSIGITAPSTTVSPS